MKSIMISGGGGARIHAIDAGNATGKPIVFIHGFSQSALCWSRQLNSPLAATFRLVAMDLRGHGLSEKPREGYADSRLWADDVHELIKGSTSTIQFCAAGPMVRWSFSITSGTTEKITSVVSTSSAL